jgi:hypothetical protein
VRGSRASVLDAIEVEIEWRKRQKAKTQNLDSSLSDYVRDAWPIVEPSTEFLPNWHIDAIAEYLEAVTAGQIKRLLINMPRGMARASSSR